MFRVFAGVLQKISMIFDDTHIFVFRGTRLHRIQQCPANQFFLMLAASWLKEVRVDFLNCDAMGAK